MEKVVRASCSLYIIFPTRNSQLPTRNSQLLTPNSQLLTPNSPLPFSPDNLRLILGLTPSVGRRVLLKYR